MTSLTYTIAAAGVTPAFSVKPGQSLTYASLGNSFTGFVAFERSRNGGASWERVVTGAVDSDISGSVKNESGHEERYRFRALDTDALTPVSGDTAATIADADDIVQEVKAPDGTVLIRLRDSSVEVPVPPTASAAFDASAGAQLATATLHLAGDVWLYQGAGAPVDYTDGSPAATGEGVTGIGSLYLDITNGKLYINGGTKAEPLWKLVTSA